MLVGFRARNHRRMTIEPTGAFAARETIRAAPRGRAPRPAAFGMHATARRLSSVIVPAFTSRFRAHVTTRAEAEADAPQTTRRGT